MAISGERARAADPNLKMNEILKGQKALVTGSDSGIGKGVAMALAEAGADVVINFAHNESAANETLQELKKINSSSNAFIFQADVSQEDQVIAMFNKALEEFGHLDILVSNAGMQKDAPLTEMTLEAWNKVLGVNLTGQFLCAREAVKHFKSKGIVPELSCAAGKIICMSSVHEIIPWAGHVNYAASKGGIMMMMKTIAQEVAPHHIRVNSICPGAIRTNINKEAWDTPEAYQKLMQLVPYNRIGEIEDIGRAAAWLASDFSDYVHGHSLVVDGGMTLYPGFIGGG